MRSLITAALAALTVLVALVAVPNAAARANAGVGINGVGYEAGRSHAANRVNVSYARRAFKIRNREERIVPGRGCRAIKRRIVRCSPERTIGGIKIEVFDGNDRVTVVAAPKRFHVALFGGRGDDVLSARAGREGILVGDSGSDVLRGSAAADQLRGDDGNDRMYGAAGVDEFHAGSGEDLIDGGPGNDHLQTGWKDDDVILGGDGNDTMFDLPFDPEMWPSDPGRDTVDGGAGDDSLSALDQVGSPEPDNVTCGPGNDFVVADSLDVLAADCEHVEFPVAPPE